MNVMKVIVGSTFALLVVGFIISFTSMRKSEMNDPNNLEIARLEKRLAELDAAAARSSIDNQFNSTIINRNLPNPNTPASDINNIRTELERLKNERDQIENDAETVIENALKFNNPQNNRKAKLIKAALLMAKVYKYDPISMIVGIDIILIPNVSAGDILGIRRGSKIIGKVAISRILRDKGIADPIPDSFQDKQIDIQPGDELILPPN